MYGSRGGVIECGCNYLRSNPRLQFEPGFCGGQLGDNLKGLNHCPSIRTYQLEDIRSWFDEHGATVYFK